jgi:hypothetical protein
LHAQHRAKLTAAVGRNSMQGPAACLVLWHVCRTSASAEKGCLSGFGFQDGGDAAHLKYLVVSLRPSSTGVSPTLCFTSQEPFTIFGISLKAPLRRSVDSGSSPPATNLPHSNYMSVVALCDGRRHLQALPANLLA